MIHPYLPGYDHAWWAYWAIIAPYNVYCAIGFVRSHLRMRKSRARLLETCAWWQGHMASEAAWFRLWNVWLRERAGRGEPPPPWPTLQLPPTERRPGN